MTYLRPLVVLLACSALVSACGRHERTEQNAPQNAAVPTRAANTAACTPQVDKTDDGLKINASACTSEQGFRTALAGLLRGVDPTGLRWVAITGPQSPENIAALTEAWRKACRAHAGRVEDIRHEEVLAHYRGAAVPSSVIGAFEAHGISLTPDSIDNLYPLNSPWQKSTGPCEAEVLPAVLYFKLAGEDRGQRNF